METPVFRFRCALITSRQITHEFHATEGTHTWRLWRPYLHDFLQRLFTPGPNASAKDCPLKQNSDSDRNQDYFPDCDWD